MAEVAASAAAVEAVASAAALAEAPVPVALVAPAVFITTIMARAFIFGDRDLVSADIIMAVAAAAWVARLAP